MDLWRRQPRCVSLFGSLHATGAMPETSRRDFLSASTSLLVGPWLATYLPAMRHAAAEVRAARAAGRFQWQVFSAEDAADFEAVAAQIFPSDVTPGAREAGVVDFADRALATFFHPLADGVRDALSRFNAEATRVREDETRFAQLSDDEQRGIMQSLQGTAAFFPLSLLTIVGMFVDPSYGGNRDRIGWNLLGFDGVFAYQPPFGYYDRGHHEGGR